MSKNAKTYITAALVVGVVGIISLQTSNTNLFKGQLDGTPDTVISEDNELETLKPDLTADLSIIAPETTDGDIVLDVTIRNQGPGVVEGQNFAYSVSLNQTEIFSNTDQYSRMEVGESFNFQYPVSRLIYDYPSEGSASISVDSGNSIDEVNEDNNVEEKDYFL
jgi:hypothetical protein